MGGSSCARYSLSSMDLRCDVCRTLLGPSGMTQGLGLGQCPACHAKLDLDRERVPGPVVPHERRPVRFWLHQDRDLIEIEWRWRGLLGGTHLPQRRIPLR